MLSVKKMSVKSSLVIVIPTLLVVFYLLPWFAMPLYPDEVAFRLQSARILTDGRTEYGLFPLCFSNIKHTPLILLPAAYTLGLIDAISGNWHFIRGLPFLSVIFLIGSIFVCLCNKNRTPWEALIMCSACIGVAGSGMMLSRPEYILVLQVGLSVLTYAIPRSSELTRSTKYLLVAINLFISSLSVAAHVQGLLMIPITALLILRLLRQERHLRPLILVPLVIVLFSLLGIQGYQNFTFACKEDPELSAAISRMTIAPHLGDRPAIDLVQQRIENHIANFEFLPVYTINYLPGIAPDASKATEKVNILINYNVLFNVICVSVLFLYVSIHLIGKFAKLFDGNHLTWTTCYDLLLSNGMLTWCASAAWLFLFFYDANGLFYRSFCLNLLGVSLIVLMAHHVRRMPVRMLVLALGIVACVTCGLSIYCQQLSIVPALKAGYEGPSISRNTPWMVINDTVKKLEVKCNVTDNVLIDDLTYEPLKAHKHLMPATYVWYRNSLVSQPAMESTTLAGREGVLKSIAKTMVARCQTFDILRVPYSYQEGNLCCTRFQEK